MFGEKIPERYDGDGSCKCVKDANPVFYDPREGQPHQPCQYANGHWERGIVNKKKWDGDGIDQDGLGSGEKEKRVELILGLALVEEIFASELGEKKTQIDDAACANENGPYCHKI